jgi:hypothetical protein
MKETKSNGNNQLPAGHSIDEADFKKLAERFSKLFSSLTEEGVGDIVSEVYADDAYLNDTLKSVRGIDSIRHYLVDSGKAVKSCQVSIDDLAQSGVDCYVRWTMDIKFKKLRKGEICRSEGISHLRFDQNGKIKYHQDFWDSSRGLFEHIPVVGSLIRMVKNRL